MARRHPADVIANAVLRTLRMRKAPSENECGVNRTLDVPRRHPRRDPGRLNRRENLRLLSGAVLTGTTKNPVAVGVRDRA